jgi:hypothetical protein
MQKIVDRIKEAAKKHQMPSSADLAALEEYGKKVANHVGAPAQPASAASMTRGSDAQGIPCEITVTMNYNHTRTNKDFTETYTMNGGSKGFLFATINGTADYTKDIAGAPASSFIIKPDVDHPGFGKETDRSDYKTDDGFERISDESGTVNHGEFGGGLFTTGSDALFGNGNFSGTADNHVEYKTISGTDSNSTHSDSVNANMAYAVHPGFTQESTYTLKPGVALPAPLMKFSYKDFVSAIRSGTTKSFVGSESFEIHERDDTYTGTSSLVITLRPKPPVLELVVEPDDAATYKKWLPEPCSEDASNCKLFTDATPISIHIAVHDKSEPAPPTSNVGGKTVPNTQIGGTIRVSLDDVSSNDGICMNFPGYASPRQGLYFPKDQPDGIIVDDEDHVHTDSDNAVEATVIVKARDTAAYGTLQATIKSIPLTSKCISTGEDFIRIPMDDNKNFIADAWETENGIKDKNYPPAWDDCDSPGNMRQNGDGLSVYEKYRGFLMDDGSGSETFKRIDPTIQNLFFYVASTDPNSALYHKGAVDFGSITGLNINFMHDNNQEMEVTGNCGLARWINFNKTKYTNGAQAAIIIRTGITDSTMQEGSAGYTPSTSGSDDNKQTPLTTIAVEIEPANFNLGIAHAYDDEIPPSRTLANSNASFVTAASKLGINLSTLIQKEPSSATLTNELVLWGLLHEIGHALGGHHHDQDADTAAMAAAQGHSATPISNEQKLQIESILANGDKACPMRYWHYDLDKTWFIEFLSGTWDPSKGPASGGSWKFCDTDWSNMSIKP